MVLFIAWRNLWRNKKRSFVMMTAIALGLCGGLFATGIMVGMAESMVNNAIDRYLGHVEIHTASFKANPLVNAAIPDGDSIAAALRSGRGVSGVSARTVIEGMALSAASNSGVRIVGIDPREESLVTKEARQLVDGAYLDGDARLTVLIGKLLAEKLAVRVRSKLVLGFAGRDGTIIYGSFRVVGIFETESTTFDRSTLFVGRRDLAGLLGGTPMVHEIAVRLADAEFAQQFLTQTRGEYPGLVVDGWKDLAPELKLTAEMTNISMLFFLAVILLGLLFGITNTMLMSVLDRVRELGVLMALGMKRKIVFSLIMLETVLLSLTGGIIGVVAGAIVIHLSSRTGINLAIVEEGLSSYGISSMLFPAVPTMMYVELGILVIATALLAAIYPGIKATTLKPAASIRSYA